MKTRRRFHEARRARERGGVLVTAILVIVVMLLMAIPFLFKLSASNRSTERAQRALAALNLAEAGVDKVLWWLNPTSGGPDNIEPLEWDTPGAVGHISGLPTNDGKTMGNVDVVLTSPVGVAPSPQTRTLTATGHIPFVGGNTVDRTVRVLLQRDYKSIFDVGFFVDEYFYIRNSFLLDAYDSRDGGYGASLPGGGTNSLLPDVYFGANSYIDDTNPRDPGDATWTIRSGGGSNDIYGTIMAGGDAAGAYLNDTDSDPTTNPPPDPSLLDAVVSVPNEDIFKGTQDRLTMKQPYELPPVDVFNLPPKEILGSTPMFASVANWFPGYNATSPELSTGYYPDRFIAAPDAADIAAPFNNPYNGGHTFSGSGNLTPANSGVYDAFSIGGVKTPGTLNISGGTVVIYVTSYGAPTTNGNGKVTNAASFYMGNSSSINIASDSTLILILGNTSVTIEQGYNINATGSPAQASRCIIMGTNQFTVPPGTNVDNLPPKADSVDALRIPGLMYFEHAQSDGNIYSAMYVPGAHITTGQGQNHMNFYGALISDSMDFKVQVDFHYDKALADLKIINGGFAYWHIVNWAEVVGGN